MDCWICYKEVIAAFVWCLFAVMNGVTDGLMYHLKDIDEELKTNEHKHFTIERSVVAIGFISLSWESWWLAGVLALTFIMTFSFPALIGAALSLGGAP